MRLFIALRFGGEVRDALLRAGEELRKSGVGGRFVPAENLHLTLAFIGEYADPDAVWEVMAAAPFSPFELKIGGFGCFGSTLWAGADGGEELAWYVKRLRRGLADAGIPFDRKAFLPHITLARNAAFPGGRFPGGIAAPSAAMTAERVSLMRSDRGKRGMIYTEIAAVTAAGR